MLKEDSKLYSLVEVLCVSISFCLLMMAKNATFSSYQGIQYYLYCARALFYQMILFYDKHAVYEKHFWPDDINWMSEKRGLHQTVMPQLFFWSFCMVYSLFKVNV